MDLEQIKELVATLENSKLKKLAVKKGDIEVILEKEGLVEALPPIYAHPTARAVHSVAAEAPIHTAKTAESAPKVDGKFVTSPMVGTFYSSPGPDQPPFVKAGDRVEENTVVCIIEAMKVMNEVKAGVSGTVAEILIDNAHPVEFGSRLYRIV